MHKTFICFSYITGVIVYANGADLTSAFKAGNDSFEYYSDDGNLVLSKDNQSLIAFFPSTGKNPLLLNLIFCHSLTAIYIYNVKYKVQYCPIEVCLLRIHNNSGKCVFDFLIITQKQSKV